LIIALSRDAGAGGQRGRPPTTLNFCSGGTACPRYSGGTAPATKNIFAIIFLPYYIVVSEESAIWLLILGFN